MFVTRAGGFTILLQATRTRDAPGTAFEDIPSDWACPQCGVGKDDFTAE